MGSKNRIYPGHNNLQLTLRDLEGNHFLQRITQAELDTLQHEKDPAEKSNLIRRMALPLSAKRILRSKFNLHGVRYKSGCTNICSDGKTSCHRCFYGCKEVGFKLTLWRNSLKKIEGHYGSAVLSYFVFLKWLFFLNIYMFLLLFVFVTIPQIVFDAQGYGYSVISDTTTDTRVNLSRECTSLYSDSVVINTTDVPQMVIDFLQGTGWLEVTLLFEGYYSDKDLAIGTFSGEKYSYNMPLAYLLVVIVCLILSLVLMVRHTANGLKNSLMDSDDTKMKYGNVVFGGWDFSMNDPEGSLLKKKVLFYELKGLVEDSRREKQKLTRHCCTKCFLLLFRVILNLFVLAVLGGSGYSIYYATAQSTQLTRASDYDTYHTLVKLLVEYIPSFTITVLNVIIPLVFNVVVKLEDYNPVFALKITLTRTVFLRLSSLAVLFGTLYTEVVCTPTDSCNVAAVSSDCTLIRCWETFVGQQIYKLTVFDFFTNVAVIFFIEFPRSLMVKCCSCKLAQWIGKPEFQVPKNVLDLVYSQTLCWLGIFFSPLVAGISVLKFFIFFYLKKLTTLVNYVPSSRPYRASKSHIFFMVVLLISFLLCCIPLGFVVWKMTPSYGCGPFRIHSSMYEIISITIATWPAVIQHIFSFIASAGFVVPAFVLTITLVYYYHAATVASREMVKLLKEQLKMEGRDKQFLIKRINEIGKQQQRGLHEK